MCLVLMTTLLGDLGPTPTSADDDLMAEVLAAAEAESHETVDAALEDERNILRTRYR